MPDLPRRYWHEMTTVDFRDLPKDTVAILPVAAIEQHGPHLTVAVDTVINEGTLARAIALMPDDLPATVLPTLPIGKSDEHIRFPGTLTLSNETLTRLWTEIGESVARAGVRKLLLLNSHGGQRQIVEIVARDLRIRRGMFVVGTSWGALGRPPGLFPDEELRNGIHGGTVETSIMLHLRPDLVRMEHAQDFVPLARTLEAEYRMLRPIGPTSFAWEAGDLNPHGAVGNAAAATAEAGRAVVEHAARQLVALLEEIRRFPLDGWAGRWEDR